MAGPFQHGSSFSIAMENLLATAAELHQSGQLDRAAELYARVLANDCQNAAAMHGLGVLRFQQGNLSGGIELLARAAALYPAVAAYQISLSEAYRGAAEALARAVESDPDNADLWVELGKVHSALKMHAQSIPCWQRVIALVPNRMEPRQSLAAALYGVGRLDEAAEQCRAAIALCDDSATAHLSLGMILEEQGDLTAAAAAFRAALAAQPDDADALARLTMLLRRELPDEDLAALERRVAEVGLDDASSAHLRFAWGGVLDERGDYHGASEQFRQANALAIAADPARGAYDPRSHERFVAGLIATCDRDFFARLAGTGLDTHRPVFVFGLPRSGTTLVEQVLASHSGVHGAGEMRLVPQLFNTLPAVLYQAQGPRDCLAHLDVRGVRSLATRHLADLWAIDGGRAERVVDKTPDNYLYLGLLAVLFPRAVFIHCRRNLRDVALSCWATDFRTLRWTNDIEHIASRVRQYRRIMEHWQAVLPKPIHHVDYEEVVADLDGAARRLVAICDLDWEPACLEFHRTARPVRTASASQVRRPIYKTSVGRWKNYERELADLFAGLDA